MCVCVCVCACCACVSCLDIDIQSPLLHPLKVPSPPEVSDEQLIEIVQSEDPMRFRVPMSLGEPHAEVDKGRSPCRQLPFAFSGYKLQHRS